MTLQQDMVSGIIFEENDLNNPVFSLGGVDYACVPSVNEVTRYLEAGGFVIDKILSMVVRMIDSDGNDIFTTQTLPQAQQVVTYNGERFRIITTKKHPTGAYIRLMAQGITRGV